MHSHPDAVVVYESDAHMKMHTPDGKAIESNGKAKDAQWTPAGSHLPENLSDKPVDAVLVELKTKPALDLFGAQGQWLSCVTISRRALRHQRAGFHR